jgi:hypothetical protein
MLNLKAIYPGPNTSARNHAEMVKGVPPIFGGDQSYFSNKQELISFCA